MTIAKVCSFALCVFTVCGQMLAQEAVPTDPREEVNPSSPVVADPTAPSPKIRQRMAAQRTPVVPNMVEPVAAPSTNPTSVAPAVAVAPSIRLKAIVLVDQDHGAAILECLEDRFSIALERQSDNERAAAFTIMNWTFTVADFTDRAVLLKSQDGSYSMWVQ